VWRGLDVANGGDGGVVVGEGVAADAGGDMDDERRGRR